MPRRNRLALVLALVVLAATACGGPAQVTKVSLAKADVVVNHTEFMAAEKKLVVEVENTGDNFGRVQQTLVAFGKKKEEAPGFPVFPHSKRRMEIPLDEDGTPSGVELQFPNFKIEQSVPSQNP